LGVKKETESLLVTAPRGGWRERLKDQNFVRNAYGKGRPILIVP